jgi:hypothetical protein
MSGSRLAFGSMRIAGAIVLAIGLSSSVRADDTAPAKAKTKTRTASSAKKVFVDELMQDAWKAAKIKPSAVAPEPEFLRRAYLDIAGRTPNVQEALAYLESKEAGKRQKLVEYLLASPDYAKNMGTIWTNALIGRKPQERQVDRRELAAWLRRGFAENRAWNEMANELITAHGSNKENGAVNYTLAHMEFEKVPLTSITARVFLGQQIQCTQCHNHPSNDWKQQDFWGINAFFKGIRARTVRKTDATGAEVDDHTELYDEPSDAYASFEQRSGIVGIAFPTFLDGRKIDQGTNVNRREALGKFITASEDNQLAKAFVNRMWGHYFGRGIVNPVDDFGAHNPPSHPELLDKLAEDFRDSGYDVKSLIKWITLSQAYSLTSVAIKENEKDETLFSHMALKPMSPEQLFDSLLTATSAHKAGALDGSEARRDSWLRQFIVTFANDEEGELSNFQGTIPQALMMMNGELMANATGGKSGSFLGNLLQSAQRTRDPYSYAINRIYLAALSRLPSKTELAHCRDAMSSSPDTIQIMEDIFWALLNSNEFVLSH